MCNLKKYKCVISTILVTVLIRGGTPFSFNERARLVFSPNGNTNGHSYFGYSLLLREGDERPLIIVGAPRETVKNPSYSGIGDPGTIYMCYISTNVNESLCTEKLLDPEGNTKHISTKGDNFDYQDRKDNMWLGMTVGGSHSNDGIAVICGPRWMNQMNNDVTIYFVPGVCYSLPHTRVKAADRRDISKLTPLVDSSNLFQTEKSNKSKHFAYGQAGISMKLSEDGKELVLGAPGLSSWTGGVVRFSIEKANKFEKNAFKKTNIYSPDLEETSYFGYSVDSGKFIPNGNILYVAGAPRGGNYKGQVLLFGFSHPDDKIFATLDGHQLGEYFGSTLAAIDINNDGLSDLIIGAPLYTQKFSFDQGRVYVYMNYKGNMVEQQASLSGSFETGARFGSSIAAIGDINNDGFIDVAIGAPYENDGMGAVYIYLGAENGLHPNYTQRIVMEDMRGFGISLSSGVDIDQNSCNDLAIGAYESAKVVLLRCHPSIDVTSTIEAFPSELSLDSTNFTAKICHKCIGATQFTAELTVNISVDLKYQSASLANNLNEAVYIVTGSNGTIHCEEIAINIYPNKNDFSRPIVIEANFDLTKNPTSGSYFCRECVVLRPSTQRAISLRVPFVTGCGDDHVCQPDLKLKVKVLERTPYVIGSSSVIALNVRVDNVGESAFFPRAQFTPPAIAPLHRVPQRCRLLESLLSCDMENRLDNGGQSFVIIELDTSKLTSLHSVITFNITVSSTGNDVTPEDNSYTVEIPLKSEAKITVVGEAASDKYVFFYSNVKKRSNITISHTYEVRNEGPTSLDIFQMQYYIPIAYRDDKTDIIYSLVDLHKPANDPFSCSVQNGNFYLEDTKRKSDEFEFNPSAALSDSIEGSLLPTNRRNSPEETMSNSHQDLLSLADIFGTDKKDNPTNIMTNENDDPLTKALNFSCTDKIHVTCLVMSCVKTGGLPSGRNGVHAVLKMQLNISNIETVLKTEGALILFTYAVALQPSKVFASSHSLIGSTLSLASTPIWIIILAICVGLLVLALISYGLYKCNFFKRKEVPENLLEHNEDVPGDTQQSNSQAYLEQKR